MASFIQDSTTSTVAVTLYATQMRRAVLAPSAAPAGGRSDIERRAASLQRVQLRNLHPSIKQIERF